MRCKVSSWETGLTKGERALNRTKHCFAEETEFGDGNRSEGGFGSGERNRLGELVLKGIRTGEPQELFD